MIKVFLVDDEIVIREGIRNSFPWEDSGYTLVGEAPDGEIALPMIRDENPDILITDIRMPFMDGMRLCQEVKRTMPWIGIVILSGYDDFNYARQAISLGVQEYLLKPISAKELKEVLDRISKRIAEERRATESLENMRRRFASGNRFVREKLLSTLFNEPLDEKASEKMLQQMRALGINLSAKCYAVIDLSFAGPKGELSAGQEALYDLAESSGGIVQVCPSKRGALALVLGDNEQDIEERVYSFSSSAAHELEQSGMQDVLCSIGETVSSFADILHAMHTARHVRHSVQAREEKKTAARIVGIREIGDRPTTLPDLNIRPLHERLQYAAIEEVPQVFTQYVRSLNATELHSSVAADYLHVEVLMTASRIVREAGGNPKDVLALEGYETKMNPLETDADAATACELLKTAIAYRDVNSPMHGNTSIAKARFYLSQHFTDPNLMLQDVATEVCMSCSRFSTVFAQETGFTFTEYLTALRVGKAKELLRATTLRSSQIAFEVGYNDPHYFSYLFKKSTGFTPSEYRKGENENEPISN